MDRDNYEVNIETWASSLMELEEGGIDYTHSHHHPQSHSSLVALSTPTYYRSKAYSTYVGINNLVNAADPILTFVSKLRRITNVPDPATLHHNICHEIKAFENKAQTFGYRPQLVMAARFILCALLDELISITFWPDLTWEKYSLVEAFHKDVSNGEQFFTILDRSLQDASAHIDLLELIYLALRFGYEGKYRGMERGLFELRNITDHLYTTIIHHKEEFSRALYLPKAQMNYGLTNKKQYMHLLPPSWLMSILMISCLIMVFIFFYIRLREVSTPIGEFLQSIQTSSVSTDPAIKT